MGSPVSRNPVLFGNESLQGEAVLSQIRWRVEARRLQLEIELFSQVRGNGHGVPGGGGLRLLKCRGKLLASELMWI